MLNTESAHDVVRTSAGNTYKPDKSQLSPRAQEKTMKEEETRDPS